MKKRNAKALKLQKKSISNLRSNQLQGGTLITNTCTSVIDDCTSVIDDCPSAWFCPTDVPTLCNLPL